MKPDYETADRICNLLNEIHKLDPAVLQTLAQIRVPCNDTLTESGILDTLQVRGRHYVGLMGLLNAVVGATPCDGTGLFYDCDQVEDNAKGADGSYDDILEFVVVRPEGLPEEEWTTDVNEILTWQRAVTRGEYLKYPAVRLRLPACTSLNSVYGKGGIAEVAESLTGKYYGGNEWIEFEAQPQDGNFSTLRERVLNLGGAFKLPKPE